MIFCCLKLQQLCNLQSKSRPDVINPQIIGVKFQCNHCQRKHLWEHKKKHQGCMMGLQFAEALYKLKMDC